MTYTICFVWIVAILTILLRRWIVGIFTHDDELVSVTSKVLIVIGLGFILDGIQGVAQGPIRALGLQRKASLIAIVSYWIFGLPFAWLLAFVCDYGVLGLLSGFSFATLGQCICYVTIVHKADWQEIADAAAERIKKEDEALDTPSK